MTKITEAEIIEAIFWLDQHAPSRAREVLVKSIERNQGVEDSAKEKDNE